MNDDDLRALFARHEHLAPAAEPVAARIEQGYRQRLRRRRVAFRSAGIAAATVVAVAAPAVAIHAVGTRPGPVPAATSGVPGLPSGPLNFLIAGTDERSGQAPDQLSRADTIIIVHVPATRDRAYLVSIPRDTYVTIPASGTYRGGSDWINAAYAYGGIDLLRRTVQTDFGIALDGAAVTGFDGFERAIQLLGGLDMCIDERTVSVDIGSTRDGKFATPYRLDVPDAPRPVPGVTPKVYEPGCRHLAPWEALDFARQWYLLPGGDTDRQRHTRQLLGAIVKQVRKSGVLADPGRSAAFLSAVQSAVRVDAGAVPLLDLVSALGALDDRSLVGVQLPTRPLPLPGLPDAATLTAEGDVMLGALGHGGFEDWVAAHPDVQTRQ